MAVVRGIAVKANAGIARCQAVEISWDPDDDYADVLTARLVRDCHHPTAFVWLGSGLCWSPSPARMAKGVVCELKPVARGRMAWLVSARSMTRETRAT
jgi:hypothetical protein